MKRFLFIESLDSSRGFYIIRWYDYWGAGHSVYLSHAGALGTAREAIIRRAVREMTPAQFDVRSGFVHRAVNGPQAAVSCQCDLLVADPHLVSPKYEVDEIVVASPESVRVAIEIKSELSQEKFDHMTKVAASLAPFQIPLLGFSYGGVAFKTIVGYLRNSAASLPGSLPAWCVIHETNCFFIRGLMSYAPSNFRYCCVQFNHQNNAGTATGYFLEFYRQYLNDKTSCTQMAVDDWFARIRSHPSVMTDAVPLTS